MRIRLPHQLLVVLYFLTDRSVLPEALEADNSSAIATLLCIFVSFWKESRGAGWEGDRWGLANPVASSFGHGF